MLKSFLPKDPAEMVRDDKGGNDLRVLLGS
ncbi:hypothetical protein V1283_007185 [Bradyrhizobium sp. AZCC 2262]